MGGNSAQKVKKEFAKQTLWHSLCGIRLRKGHALNIKHFYSIFFTKEKKEENNNKNNDEVNMLTLFR